MRPLELAVEGFTSFRDAQVIDFRPLGLFVITGPTGSGKTSILDALTLALYGEVARAGKNDVRSLVSTGQNAARVRLDFEVAGTRYRVVRRFPRNGNQAVSLERFDGELLVPEVESGKVREIRRRIEVLVGLDFEAFTRAVLLPQGDFSRFLRGAPEERKGILEKLLDLGRYKAAGKRAGDVARELRGRADTLEGHLGRTADGLTDEALEALRQVEARTLEDALRFEEKDRQGGAILDQLRAIRERRDALDDLEGRLLRVAGEWGEWSEQRRRVEPRRVELDQRRRDLEGRLSAARDHEASARSALERVLREGGSAADLARMEGAVVDRGRVQGSLAEARSTLEAARKSMVTLEGDRERLAVEVDGATREEQAARQRAEAARVAVQEARTGVERARSVAARRGELAAAREGLAAVGTTLGATGAREREARGALEVAREELERLQQAHTAAGLRLHLAAGEPCPVCDQMVHQLPGESGASSDLLEEAGARCGEAEERWKQAEGELHRGRGLEVGARVRVETLEQGLTGEVGVPPLVEAEALLAGVEEEARQAQGVAREREEALTRVREASGRAAAALQERGSLITRMDEELLRQEGRRVEIDTLLATAFPEGVPEEPAGAIRERQARLQGAEASARTARTVLEAMREEEDALKREESSFRDELGRLESRKSALEGGIRELVAVAGRLGIEAPEPSGLEEAQGPPGGIGTLVSAVGVAAVRLSAERSGALDRLRIVVREVAGDAGGADGALDPAGVRTLLAGAHRRARDAAVRASEAVRSTQERLAQVRETRREIEALRATAELHHRLWLDLNSRNFLDYLLQESIQDLAGAASGELNRVSNGRYSLASEGTEFMVVDHNNADETRSVVTLSGGETFLASLSLALSLAGAVRDLAGSAAASRLETILIDEGFGALDQATLDVAIEALERLQQDQRMVGIITHVQELADRIPSGLEVVPGVAGAGSRVVVRGAA